MLKGRATRYGWFVCLSPVRTRQRTICQAICRTSWLTRASQGAEYLLFDVDSIPVDDLPILHPSFRGNRPMMIGTAAGRSRTCTPPEATDVTA